MSVTASSLPLPLNRPTSDQPPASQLPLALTRPLGTSVDVPPPEPLRLMDGVSNCLVGVTSASQTVADHVRSRYHGQLYAERTRVSRLDAIIQAQSSYWLSRGFMPVARDVTTLTQAVHLLSHCQSAPTQGFVLLNHCHSSSVVSGVGFAHYQKIQNAPVVPFVHCDSLPLQPSVTVSHCHSASKSGKEVAASITPQVSDAIPVPCRYYPIPEPPPIEEPRVCRVRPPSSRLPLPLTRRRIGLPASALPLPLMCWHDAQPVSIPNLRSYIVHNTITATVGGIAVDPMTFDFKCPEGSYCWRGEIAITAKDYARIKSKLDVPQGSEPLVTVMLNNTPYTFIAEENPRSRKFGNHSYSLSGRSITARLSKDYAAPLSGLVTEASYASQIVTTMLSGTGITLGDWEINDWLIPANTYALTGKAPIDVISDIAAAAGGFVETDLSGAVLSIKPRWKVAAWELATATPDVTLPMDVTREITDQPRKNPRYNTVTLVGASDGGVVYRQAQARDLDAPAEENPLYTDRDVVLPAGIAILSDSGTHGDYTLIIRQSDKYNIPLARRGQVWQINDPEGNWRGMVRGGSLSVKPQNDAPTVWQSVTVDRYLDV